MALGEGRRKSVLDEERCFKLYYETGSLYKVATIFANEGVVNPETGRPYTVMGIHTAAWRWGTTHKNEAKQMIQDSARVRGEILSDDEMERIITARAKYLHCRSKVGWNRYVNGG